MSSICFDFFYFEFANLTIDTFLSCTINTPGTSSANANMAPTQVALSSIWAVVVIYFFGNLAYNGVQGGMLSNSFHRTMELLGVNV